MSQYTFLAFGDLHHYPGVFYPDREQRWAKIVARSVEEKAEFMFGLTAADVESVDAQHRLSYARRSVPFIRDYAVDLTTDTVIRSCD